jgi:hypothetical protein
MPPITEFAMLLFILDARNRTISLKDSFWLSSAILHAGSLDATKMGLWVDQSMSNKSVKQPLSLEEMTRTAIASSILVSVALL